MAWELPSSITRALDRLAISRVQRLEGEDSIVPTVEMLSLDQPPFRKAGHRFFASAGITSDASGGQIALGTSSERCTLVVDSLVISITAATAVVVKVGSVIVSPEVSGVFVPELSLMQPLPPTDARIMARAGEYGGQHLYIFEAPAGMTQILGREIVLQPRGGSEAYLGTSVQVTGITLRVSISGRIWYSEE